MVTYKEKLHLYVANVLKKMITYQENPHLYVAIVLEETGNEELIKFAEFILETKLCDWKFYFKEAEERLSKEAYNIGVNALVKDKNWRVRRDCAEHGSDKIKEMVKEYERSLGIR